VNRTLSALSCPDPDLANLAEEDPLLRAAHRWKTLHKLAPDLIEALEFRAARAGDPVLALQLLTDMHRSAKRERPPGRKDHSQCDGDETMRLDSTGIRRAEIAEWLGISEASVYRILIRERAKPGWLSPRAASRTGRRQAPSCPDHARGTCRTPAADAATPTA
jgi:CRP-like cAMP-binding protein